MSGIMIDLIIIAIVALFTFIGYKQGLIKSAIKILSFFIAIVVALVLYKPVSNVIINSSVGEKIKSSMVNTILPEGVSPDEEVDIRNTISNIVVENSRDTVNNVAYDIMVQIVETGTLLLIFIIVRVVLRFVTVLTDLITKLPVLKQFDKTGGVIYGVFRGVVLVFTIFALIFLFAPVTEEKTIDAVNESWIGGTIYNNNALIKILFK